MKYRKMNLRTQLLKGFLFVLSVFPGMFCHAQQDSANVYLFGGEYFEESSELVALQSGGFAFIGSTGSDQQSNTEFYLVVTDENFECSWSRVLGSFGADKGYGICQDDAGDLLVCGFGAPANSTDYDIKVFRLSESGEILWQKEYGGSDWDFGKRIVQHPSGGFLICGTTYSAGNGDSDGYLLHINDEGEIITEWTYGDIGEDGFNDVDVTDDSIVISGYGENLINGKRNAQIIKLDFDGSIVWVKTDVLTDHSSEYLNTRINENYIFSCGNYLNETEHQLGFMMCRYLDSSSIFWMNAENHNGDYVFSDFVFNENNIFLVGYTNAYGDGSDNGTITVNNFYGSWQNAITIGTNYLNFTSGVISSDRLVLAVKTLNSDVAPTFQGGLFVYPDLTPVAGSETTWHNSSCFAVDQTELVSEEMFEYVRYFDMTGRAVTALLTKFESQGPLRLPDMMLLRVFYGSKKEVIAVEKVLIQ